MANVSFPCLQELCFLIHAPFSSRKGTGIHKDFCRQPQIAAGRHILLSVSYHCSPVQCNICNCLFLLLNFLSLCSNYIMKNNISTISRKVRHFFPQLRRSQRSFFWSFGRHALGLFMCHWLSRSRQSSWGSRPLDHITTTKNHSENHYQTPPNKSNSILSNSWDKNSTIVQNTSHPVWGLLLLLSLLFESIHESIKFLAPLVECHSVSSVCCWMLMNYFGVVKIQ